MNEDREAFIQRMIDEKDISRTMASHMWDARQVGGVIAVVYDIDDKIESALSYSRNFANSKPNIGLTEKEHILGLAKMLDTALIQIRVLRSEARAALAPAAVDEIARVKNAAREIRDHLKKEVARLETDLEHARKKVLVVMPEKKESRQFDPAGWNAALDEVARLNRNPIPVELLERVCADRSLTSGRNAAVNAIDELRALIGKEEGGQ